MAFPWLAPTENRDARPKGKSFDGLRVGGGTATARGALYANSPALANAILRNAPRGFATGLCCSDPFTYNSSHVRQTASRSYRTMVFPPSHSPSLPWEMAHP